MKLKNLDNTYLKYWHNGEEIDIPDYAFNKDSLRGVWIATVCNMDVPIMKDINEYKAYLISILDNMVTYNMNTAVFHIRPCNDAFYPSKINPWSKYITGTEGIDPGFDILQFMIDEGKKRNIRIHAWFNPYRVTKEKINEFNLSKDEYLDTLSINNWARIHKEHTILDGVTKIILRPGHPEVVDYVINSIMEVAEKYDIDAVHMDDFFYPYDPVPMEDEYDDYLKYKKEDESFKDWRIRNVDTLINKLHNQLVDLYNRTGKKVELGISPFPIYRTHSSILETGWEKGSYNSKGAFQCYDGQYSDIYKWMKEGWIDYVVPQDYFSFRRSDVTYHDTAWWWSGICKETNTKLYIGQAIYRMGSEGSKDSPTWQDPEEINNQLRFNCNFDNIDGTIFFSYKSFIKGSNPILDEGLDRLKLLWNNKSK